MFDAFVLLSILGYCGYVVYVKLHRPDIAQRWKEEKRERQRRMGVAGVSLIKWGLKRWK